MASTLKIIGALLDGGIACGIECGGIEKPAICCAIAACWCCWSMLCSGETLCCSESLGECDCGCDMPTPPSGRSSCDSWGVTCGC